ncbi:MAG: Ubiquinol oxidase subunit 2 [Nevskia sp.]|nr:Ubiquinol oxidase subunit 2 [Nevskia sp.]
MKAFATLLASLALCGCSDGIFDPHGAVGVAEKTILLNSLFIMMVVGAPIILATLLFAWWFRASNRHARYLPYWVYSGRLEVIVWVIPGLVVLFLGGIAWIGSHDLDPYKPLQSEREPLQVEVVSLDWKWLFIYPEQQVASVNELVVPAGRPVHFRLTSATVMNSFFIPQLGSQIYTMAGMATELNLIADQEGTYHGLSAQFSGDGFSDMHFEARAVSDADFIAWARAAATVGPPLDAQGYQQLLKPGTEPTPHTYAAVAPGLFDTALMLPMQASAAPHAPEN